MRLEIGQKIKTNYSQNIYTIERIVRHCNCPHILDEVEEDIKPLVEHLHLTLRCEDKTLAYLNYYDERTLANIKNPGDKIIVLQTVGPIQTSLV